MGRTGGPGTGGAGVGRYWDWIAGARMNRRRFLVASAAAAAGIAAACRNDTTIAPLDGTPDYNPRPRTAISEGSRGGMYRAFGFDAIAIDTFDPHQTEFGPLTNMHAAVFSKLLKYDDEVRQIMSPDLATAMPEVVDETTYLVRIRSGAAFHDTPRIRQSFPGVAGRQVTAEDVRYSIERQINPDSPQRARFMRSGQWAALDRIEVVDDATLRFTTKAPLAPFVHYMADRSAFIVPRECVDANDEMNAPERMIGSGPFMLDEFSALEAVRVIRNPRWFASEDLAGTLGGGRPFLDGYEVVWHPQNDTMVEEAFRSRQVDIAEFFDQAMLEAFQGRSQYGFLETPMAALVQTRLLVDRPPFDDPRVRRALHLVVDRWQLGEQILGGLGSRPGFQVSGPVAPAMARWAIPQEDLIQKPGYRTDPEGREEDMAEARKLWEAAKSDGRAPEVIPALFAGQPRFIPEVALPQMERARASALGVRLESELDITGYTQIFACLASNRSDDSGGACVFTWSFDNGWIDLDDWLYPFFHSEGVQNSFRLKDDQLDAMLEAQRREFDFDRRRELGLNAQHYLLDRVNARIEYVCPIGRWVHWSYVKNAFWSTWMGDNFRFADVWLDHGDPAFAGRK